MVAIDMVNFMQIITHLNDATARSQADLKGHVLKLFSALSEVRALGKFTSKNPCQNVISYYVAK